MTSKRAALQTLCCGWALWGGVHCNIELDIPESTRIRCTSNHQCPAGMTCSAKVGLCAPKAVERDPPTFETVSINRHSAAVGVDVEVSFSVSEALLTEPAVALITEGEERIPLPIRQASPPHFVVGYTPTGQEKETTWSFAVTMLDLSGNEAVDLSLAEVALDFVVPQIIAVTPSRPALSLGESVTLSVEVDEPLATASLVLWEDTPAVSEVNANPLIFPFTYLAAGGAHEQEGPVPAHIRVEDKAGNITTTAVEGAFVFDSVEPTVVTQELPSAPARAGVTIPVTVEISEPLDPSSIPLVQMERLVGQVGTGDTIDMQMEYRSSTMVGFVHTVTHADADGTYSVRLLTYQDLAGNEGTNTDLGQVLIDKSPPALVDLLLPTGLVPGQLCAVSFSLDEAVVTPPSMTFSGGSTSLTMTQRTPPEDGYEYTFEITAPTSGDVQFYTFTVNATDLAGNQRIENVGVVGIDLVPPELVSLQMAPPAVKPGDMLGLVLSADERLEGPPPMVAETAGGNTITLTPVSGSQPRQLSYTYTCVIQLSDVPGTYTIQPFDLIDGAGNSATITPPPTATFAVDTTPPHIDSGSATLRSENPFDATVATTGDQVTLVFSVDEIVTATPTALLGGNLMTHVSSTVNGSISTHTFSYDADQASDTSGIKEATVTVTDDVGNQTVENLGTLVFDFAPPQLLGAPTLQLIPASSNPLFAVSRATGGTRVRLTFTLDEEIRNNVSSDPPTPRVVGLSTSLVLSQIERIGSLYVYETTITGVADDQDFTEVLRIETDPAILDVAGNSPAVPMEIASFQIDTSAPAVPDVSPMPDDSPRIEYRRVPWGSDTTAGAPLFTIEGQAGAVQPNHVLLVFDRSDVQLAIELGRTTAASDGSFAELELLRADREQVYVAAVDEAGNLSDNTGTYADGLDATAVLDVRWTASLAGKESGSVLENPHAAELSLALWPTLAQDADRTFALGQADLDALYAQEGTTALVSAERVWQPMHPTEDQPLMRRSGMMAYDSHRGHVVLFGGLGPGTGCGTSGTPECDDTWEWDGYHWLEVTSYGSNPPERQSAAMAFDSSRAVTLLFGGADASGLAIADTWAWDGTQWEEQVASTSVPSARQRHAMAYDPARGRVVLFGGLGVAPLADTWEWDRWGTVDCSNEYDPCWRRITPVGDTPAARFNHAMAYDPALGGIVLYGGHAFFTDCNATGPVCTDTWLWNGAAWQDLSENSISTPPASCAATLVFDTTTDVLILFGGNDGSGVCGTASGMQQTWAFGDWGTPTCASAGVRCWKQLAPSTAPPARSFTTMAFHNQLGRAILFGGTSTSGSTLADTWEWIGANWRELSPSISRPAPRAELSMAYDTTHRSVVVFGGNHYQPGCNGSSTNYCGDLWSWDGVSWRELKNDTSMARTQAAAAYQSSRDRLLLFGGYDGTLALSDTWEWDGSAWEERCDGTPGTDVCSAAPTGRYLAASTYDAANQVALVFGGDSSSTLFQETWGFGLWGTPTCGGADDPCWRDLTPAGTSPTSRRAAAMTYDSHRQVVVLFGGFDGSTRLDDTWEWNGSSSSWAEACTSSPCADNRPPARESATLAYDTQRRRIVLLGGYSNTGVRLGDAWEWDGSSWIAMTPTEGPRPAARRNAQAAFDVARQRLVYFGGDVSDEPRSDTWEWATHPTLRPAVVTHFEWSSYLGAAHEVRSLDLSAFAGARGYATLIPGTGTEQSGAELLIWDYRAGRWQSRDTGSAGMGAGDLLSFTSSSATEAQQHVAGDFIHVLVQPREGLGTGTGLPAVDLDYLETTVRYRLTAP